MSAGGAGVIGPWPAPCPVAPGERAALWLDGGVAGAAAAAWLTGCGVAWLALVPADLPAPRARAAAAQAADRPVVPFAPAGPPDLPGGWGPAHAAATAAGAAWLVFPAPFDPPAAPRWATAFAALEAAGLRAWRPFAMLDAVAVARLALAAGADLAATAACDAEPPCGACPGCRERREVWGMLGRPR